MFGITNRFWWLPANKGRFIHDYEQLENKHHLFIHIECINIVECYMVIQLF